MTLSLPCAPVCSRAVPSPLLRVVQLCSREFCVCLSHTAFVVSSRTVVSQPCSFWFCIIQTSHKWHNSSKYYFFLHELYSFYTNISVLIPFTCSHLYLYCIMCYKSPFFVCLFLCYFLGTIGSSVMLLSGCE